VVREAEAEVLGAFLGWVSPAAMGRGVACQVAGPAVAAGCRVCDVVNAGQDDESVDARRSWNSGVGF
jgi:hypothetical protein